MTAKTATKTADQTLAKLNINGPALGHEALRRRMAKTDLPLGIITAGNKGHLYKTFNGDVLATIEPAADGYNLVPANGDINDPMYEEFKKLILSLAEQIKADGKRQ